MDSISEQRLSLVHPLLSTKVHAMGAALEANGIYIRVIQGYRTYAEQHALYMQSRTNPPTGPKVTDADEGYSMHNFGFAVDCVPGLLDREPWTPDWNFAHPFFVDMIHAGEAQDLLAGATWNIPDLGHDYPHFQLKNLPVTPTDQMRTDFLAGGLPLVWTKFEAGVY